MASALWSTHHSNFKLKGGPTHREKGMMYAYKNTLQPLFSVIFKVFTLATVTI